MKKIMVLLVSQQTVPNFLFLKSFHNIDTFMFITSTEMESEINGNKRQWLEKASEINKEKSNFKIVNAEYKSSVIEKLKEFNWDEYDDIIVNVTGGTKMMSIACYEFFKDMTRNIWYLPIGKDVYHQCDSEETCLNIEYKMSVKEYLDCCGILKNESGYTEKNLTFNPEFTTEFFDKFTKGLIKKENLEEIRLLFRDDRAVFAKEMAKKRKIDLDLIEDSSSIKAFLSNIGFTIEGSLLTKDKMEYLTGGWFEEYVYNLFKSVTNLDDKYFKLGVVLNPTSKNKEKLKYFTKNDLDVVLVFNNTLYVIECKSGGMEKGDLYNKTVYLASALRKYFGLNVKSILCTLSNMDDDKIEKANTLGIDVIDSKFFYGNNVEDQIKKLLKIKSFPLC